MVSNLWFSVNSFLVTRITFHVVYESIEKLKTYNTTRMEANLSFTLGGEPAKVIGGRRAMG